MGEHPRLKSRKIIVKNMRIMCYYFANIDGNLHYENAKSLKICYVNHYYVNKINI